MSFRVLFVCTGNLCRSPIAAALFQARVRRPDIRVISAGTHAQPGRPIDAIAAQVLRDLGHADDAHVAKRITPALVESSQLVLTATLDHRKALLSETPTALRRSFSLLEFVRLGHGLGAPPADDPAKRVAEVAAQRGLLDPGRDDIEDPFGKAPAVMRECAAEIAAAVTAAADILGLTYRPRPPGRHRAPEPGPGAVALAPPSSPPPHRRPAPRPVH